MFQTLYNIHISEIQPITAQSVWSKIQLLKLKNGRVFSTKIRYATIWKMLKLLNFRFPEG